jgi:hypothetical protein
MGGVTGIKELELLAQQPILISKKRSNCANFMAERLLAAPLGSCKNSFLE